MYQIILATTIDDLPCLSVETFTDARAMADRLVDAVDIHNEDGSPLRTFIDTAAMGSTIILHDADHGEPVAVVTRVGAAS